MTLNPCVLVSLCYVMLLATSLVANGVPIPQFSEVEQLVLDARDKISDYHIKLLITDELNNKEGKSITKLAFDLMHEDNKLKVYRYSGHTLSATEEVADVVCVNCEYPDTCLNYSTQPVENGEISLAFYEINERGKFDLRDPLKIGLIPLASGVFHAFNIEDFLKSPDRTDKKVEQVIYQGAECYKLTWQDKHANYTVFVDRKKSYNIVKWICDASNSGYHATVDIDLSEYSENVWFPKKAVFKSVNQNKEESSEIIDIDIVSLNKPLAPDTFSLKGIKFLPKQTSVIWASAGISPFGQNNFWDGNKLISKSPIKQMVPSPNYTRFLIYINIAVILLFIGIRVLMKKTSK